jgi:hypothetical protein
MKLENSRQIFEKYSNIKFYENMLGGRRVVSMGQTNMTKQAATFHNFAMALTKCQKKRHRNLVCELHFL